MAIIKDGTGKGYEAQVDSNKRLRTSALTTSIQHQVSHAEESAYQVWSEYTITTTDDTMLSLTNLSNTKDIIVTYIRVHTAGSAATNEDAYFSIQLGGNRVSGGTELTPVNMHVGSPNIADAIVYGNTEITMDGTEVVSDKMHTANTEIAYNKEGSLILPKNSTLSINFKGSTAAGIAYARVSFFYAAQE